MQPLVYNDAGILVFNINLDSYFCSGCAEQAQNWFWNLLKIKSSQQANLEKLSRNAVVYQATFVWHTGRIVRFIKSRFQSQIQLFIHLYVGYKNRFLDTPLY